MRRSSFIKKLGISAGLLSLGSFPFQSLAACDVKQLTILHTNDLHIGLQQSNYKALLTTIDERINDDTLLLDAGDMFHGKDMMSDADIYGIISRMKYDAVTLGEHDFDMGIDALALRIKQMNFPVLIANYDLSRTALHGLTQPYTIINKAGIKIGVFGIVADLDRCVKKDVSNKITYIDPLVVSLRVSEFLKCTENCDMVVCLSHLGYEHVDGKVSDKIIAAASACIDLVIGGHTHTALAEPLAVTGKNGKEVVVNQCGWGGLKMGELKYCFDSKKSSKLFFAQSVIASKQTSAV